MGRYPRGLYLGESMQLGLSVAVRPRISLFALGGKIQPDRQSS